ncbi:MAG: hypothetical protein LBI19_00925 [Oscillospiraceae bacterium]|nr:hypothetical protein [Oscillospiraceae bacterium]
MDAKKNSRERILLLLLCVLVLGAAYIVLLSVNIIAPIGEAPVFGVEEIGADLVVLRHEFAAANRSAAVNRMVTVTDPSAVRKLLSIHNTMQIKSTSGTMDRERYALYFYQNDELVVRWHLDSNGITDFSTRHGDYSIENDDFDFAYIKGLLT